MPVMRVNPTRMELSRLKKRLKTAVRGHKLLKDKRDEMIRRFVDFVRRNQSLRRSVEEELAAALRDFLMARAAVGAEVLEEAVLWPARQLQLRVGRKNIMSVDVPIFEVVDEEGGEVSYPYGFMTTSAELDAAIAALNRAALRMIELAQMEKACNMLADEIEKTRRRVNALEYVMIPDMTDTIRAITMKLDENERGNLTRLMKVKEMLAEQASR
ncbi:MAG: V-type ATP synthase subunit D [Clostridiales bacterium]|nr:V-type ATP synthase subunit D [Clostridiales bacterium]